MKDRFYQVKFRGSLSDPFEATSGVPQGSHLGPLLFILSINDVNSIIKNSNFLIYADDMKIFKKVEGINDCTLLQMDLKAFEFWCAKNSYI